MDLKTYLDRPGALSRSQLCDKLGISAGRLSQLRDLADWPPELALKLEEATCGAICASDISPIIAKARGVV